MQFYLKYKKIFVQTLLRYELHTLKLKLKEQKKKCAENVRKLTLKETNDGDEEKRNASK